MRKLLFLCSQNRRRSLTAEKIFDGCQDCTARSAGTESNARVKVTVGMIGWADIIRKIREYNSLRHVNMTPSEIVEDTRQGAAELLMRLKEGRKVIGKKYI